MTEEVNKKDWRTRLHEIIFEADTKAGRLFDVILILSIFISVIVTMLSTVDTVDSKWHFELKVTEWVLTIFFTIEYILRIIALRRPKRYVVSKLGFIDLMAFLPTYLELFMKGSKYFSVIRVFRLIRIFRILKLVPYVKQLEYLRRALYQSRRKIFVFAMMVLSMVIILGSFMYLIEGPENGFTSIPRSIYWAVVTLTTVGFGDITPQTTLGQFLSTIVMLLGYAIIAVPTGLISVEMSKSIDQIMNTQSCPDCGFSKHDTDAKFCKICGKKLN